MLFGRKRRYAGRHFPAVSLFDAAGLPQRYFVVSVQPLLYGRLRSSSHRDFPVSKAVQSRCLNGLRAQLRFLCKGTYGTSGWMQPREVPAVLDMVSDLSQHTGTVLGMLNGKYLCIPGKTRMNGNLAVYGASGSMKTRSFCMNRILQSALAASR